MINRSLQDDLARSKKGDEQAFARVVNECYPITYRFAIHIMHDDQEAEDVVQEAFVRVWKNLDRIDPEKKLTTLLYTIVGNLCIDHLRARKRMLRIAPASSDDVEQVRESTMVEDIQSHKEFAAIVRQLSHELPPKQMLVFTLRDIEDLPVEEVAQITGLSKDVVKANLYYARAAIRRSLRLRYSIERGSL